MKNISLGKYRGLTQTSTSNSVFSILALDHRNNLRQALNPANPDQVSFEDIVSFKSQVVKNVSSVSSAVLLDPELSAAQNIANGSLPGNKGLVCAVEETGYAGDPDARMSRILPGWSINKAKRIGASAVKLLVYYHPQSKSAKMIEDLVRQIVIDCEIADMALFLEPLSYSLVKGTKLTSSEKRSLVVETARRLGDLGADVLKVEFPLDVISEPDEHIWVEASNELNRATVTPWVLLSASVDYDTYIKQARIACEAGASGVVAGRAVWKEALNVTGCDRLEFLRNEARDRMQNLTDLCDQLAVPWTNFYATSEIEPDWFKTY